MEALKIFRLKLEIYSIAGEMMSQVIERAPSRVGRDIMVNFAIHSRSIYSRRVPIEVADAN